MANRQGRGLVAVMAAACMTSTVIQLGASPAGAAPIVPAVANVEVQPDQRTVQVSWDHTGQSLYSYEIWWRASGTTTWQWVSTSAGGEDRSWVPYVPGQSSYVERLKMPDSVAGTAVDVSIRALSTSSCSPASNCSSLDAAQVVNVGMDVRPTALPSPSASSISLSWTPASGAFQFYSYDLFLKPSAYAGNLTGCWAGWEPNRTSTSRTLSSVPATCGGGQVQANTQYEIGVRVLQKSSNPTVWGAVGTAVVTTPSALPAHCQSTDELFCVNFPDSFVKTAAWPLAEQGDPVVLNGANLKHAPVLDGGNWNTPWLTDYIDSTFGGATAPGWNAMRINMDWPTYQIKSGGSIIVDSVALDQLDATIDAAVSNGYYVILNPAHVRRPGSGCSWGARMNDATHDIPKWMWDLVAPGMTPNCSGWSTTASNLEDEVFARPEFKTYIRSIADRYSDFSTPEKAARSEAVVAIDLINEPKGSGGIQTRQANMLANYSGIVSDVRANTSAADKILMAQPVHGDTSLAQNGSDVASFASTSENLMWSFHDYFGGGINGTTPSTSSWGYGRDAYGFPGSQERTYQTSRPYTYANEEAQHRTYVEQSIAWATAHELPVFVGEYGVINPCNGNVASEALGYAEDTRDLYDTIPEAPGSSSTVSVSRTWWVNGYWNDMELVRKESVGAPGCGPAPGDYFAHAAGTT